MKNIVFHFLLAILLTSFVQAQEANVIVDGIRNEAINWSNNIRPFIHRLFLMLATLDFVWMAINLCIKGSPLEQWTGQVVKKILFYGIGLYFLFNGFSIARDITNSFIQLASIASGSTANLTAVSIWEQGLELASNLFNNNSFWDGIKAQIFGGFAAIIILLLCAYISGVILLAYAEAFIVMGAGTVVLGLGGSQWTGDYARKYFTFALATGVRLFITLLLGQLGATLIATWIASINNDNIGGIFSGLMSFFVFAMLIQKIPNTIAGMLSGAGIQGSESAVGGSIKMGAMAAATVATGGLAAVKGAAVLAKAEGAKGVAGMAGGTAKNLARGFGEDMSKSFAAKEAGVSNQPSMGHRMSARMESKASQLQTDQNKAKASSGSANSNSVGGGDKNAQSQNSGQGSQQPAGGGSSNDSSTSNFDNTADNVASGAGAETLANEGSQQSGGGGNSNDSSTSNFDNTADNVASAGSVLAQQQNTPVNGDFTQASPTASQVSNQGAVVGSSPVSSMGGSSPTSGMSGSMGSSTPQASPTAPQVSNQGAVVGSSPVSSMGGSSPASGMSGSMGSSTPQASPTAPQVSNQMPENGDFTQFAKSGGEQRIQNQQFDNTADNMQLSALERLKRRIKNRNI